MKKAIDTYRPGFEYRILTEAEAEQVASKAGGLTLTDDFAPTENLLTPVVRQSAIEFLTHRYRTMAKDERAKGNLAGAIANYRKMIETDFTTAVEAYNEIGIISAQTGDTHGAIDAFEKAIDANERIKPRGNSGNMHFSLAVVLQSANKPQQAAEHFKLAIAEFAQLLAKDPTSVKFLMLTGDSYASMGDFLKAAEYFSKDVDQEPTNINNHLKRIQALEYAGQISRCRDRRQTGL